ncbi:MAG: hypothetical protein JO270_17735 [Acidobacteriaceae bacterium]|nr:hypothetical protein [Acidobacteriaceae bacterium]MBV8572830.1 hypothetical protein [Acidobacteriaceae bacterium]
MAAEDESTGKLRKVYVTEVGAAPGELVKSILEQLAKDTDLVERSDYVLVIRQKNHTGEPPPGQPGNGQSTGST